MALACIWDTPISIIQIKDRQNNSLKKQIFQNFGQNNFADSQFEFPIGISQQQQQQQQQH